LYKPVELEHKLCAYDLRKLNKNERV